MFVLARVLDTGRQKTNKGVAKSSIKTGKTLKVLRDFWATAHSVLTLAAVERNHIKPGDNERLVQKAEGEALLVGIRKHQGGGKEEIGEIKGCFTL